MTTNLENHITYTRLREIDSDNDGDHRRKRKDTHAQQNNDRGFSKRRKEKTIHYRDLHRCCITMIDKLRPISLVGNLGQSLKAAS